MSGPLSRLGRLLGFGGNTNKRVVGKDMYGNQFVVLNEGTREERRMVEAPKKIHNFEVEEIHPVWASWLQKKRQNPPTEEEYATVLARETVMKYRVEEYNETQAKLDAAEEVEKEKRALAAKKFGVEVQDERPKHEERFQVKTGLGATEFQPEGWTPKRKK